MILYTTIVQELYNAHILGHVGADINVSKILARFLELETYVRCVITRYGTDIRLC